MRWEKLAEWERDLSLVLEAVQDARRIHDFDHESKQKAFESGITPGQFVRGYASASVTATSSSSGDTDAPPRPTQVASSGIMPFDALLLAQGNPPVVPLRPPSWPRALKLLGVSVIGTGLLFIVLGLAFPQAFEPSFYVYSVLTCVGGLILMGIGLQESQQREGTTFAKFELALKSTGRSLAAISLFGRHDQPVGAIAACEDAPELLIVAGTSPVMAIPASKIRSAEAVEDKVSLGVGGAVNIQGIWLGGLLPASYTKYTGVTILLDDLRYPRLNIEFPTLAEAAQWEDILNVLRART